MGMITITWEDGQKRMVPEGTVLLRLAQEYQHKYENDILLAMVDGNLKELRHALDRSCNLKFITARDAYGMRAYVRSLQLMMNRAVYSVIPVKNIHKLITQFSVTTGLFVELEGDFELNQELLGKIEDKMHQMVEENLPIHKTMFPVSQARELFHKMKMFDKERLFRYRRSSWVNLYSIDGFIDYFYGYMVPSTGYLKHFALELYHNGFVLRTPSRSNPGEVAPFIPHEKLFDVMMDSEEWSKKMNLSTVGDINDMISQGKISDMVLITEARQEKKIADIAQMIASDPHRKFVLIAGPSSSGKTSFSHRLSIQLMGLGLKPHPIAADDYFVNREDNPVDENGNYDYEALECVDIAQFNADMNALLEGKTVPMPTFNFVDGKREYHGETMTLGPNDILIIEGIHCLNDKMTEFIPQDSKFRIYISALTQLNIDEHNRIPTTDGRLIRRMIRDARTRGASAQATIARWPSVRRGEERNIFPYQESADVMFNSSLVYEFSVMKSYAEQLLFGIPEDCPEYQEAKRLLKFFDYFLAVDSKDIPSNSLIKEFIGGSVFKV